MSPTDEERFSRLVAEVAGAGRVPLMRECVQHGQVSTWEHCVRVAHASLAMARALRLRVSERELVVLCQQVVYALRVTDREGSRML
ncbi:hypothetical protein [Paratractidigestivibacter faecalis]|uniref:hypothetical protein n=1 Tax=Paratractidigestivibacter faecalis TaxID=2292441 RepID=UPI003A937A5C